LELFAPALRQHTKHINMKKAETI